MLKSDKHFGEKVKGWRRLNCTFLNIDIKVVLFENMIFLLGIKGLRALASVVCGKERNRQSEQLLQKYNCRHMPDTFKEQPIVAVIDGYSGVREGQINKRLRSRKITRKPGPSFCPDLWEPYRLLEGLGFCSQ